MLRALTIVTLPVPVQIQTRSFGTFLSYRYLNPKQKGFRSVRSRQLPSTSTFAFAPARSMSGLSSKISLQNLGDGKVEMLDSLEKLRVWRKKARLEDKDVGFVPTMGALHDGHLSLVRESLAHNPLTVVSIFVNPAQFAPHEDLVTYPRTIERDVELLIQTKSQSESQSDSKATSGKRLVVFIPSAREMYPSGITQDVNEQRGTFIRVQGYEDEMEGKARPGFFRGVATVVIKLFNAVEPTQAYFGQKDIQQALLLRRLCSDLLLSHPTPSNLHIVPTGRDPNTGLALSSRNAYLTEKEHKWAPVLWNGILKGKAVWESSFAQDGTYYGGADNKTHAQESSLRERVVAAASNHILETAEKAKEEGVDIRLNYIELNWADTFKIVKDEDLLVSSQNEAEVNGGKLDRAMIISGAVWVGRTRLIDNMILGDIGNIIA